RVNGVGGDTLERGSYLCLTREWRKGDVVEVALPMPVRRMASHPRVAANTGRVALARGPLIYCLEGVDHPGVNLFDLTLPTGGELVARHERHALGGVTVIHGEGLEIRPDSWNGQLYRTDGESESATPRPVALTAVPYFAWANRSSGQMQVWSRSR
ncbi:MAG TPA: glycoside hydrolase family 127 protein, partial [Chloroflexota bacterium]|nr:glycoside hydrolase family 127 protein [Chloroflexota bacterium]